MFYNKKFFFLFFLIILFFFSNILILKNSFQIKQNIKKTSLFFFYEYYGLNFPSYFSNRFKAIGKKKNKFKINIDFKNLEKLDLDKKNYHVNGPLALETMNWVPVEIDFNGNILKAKIRLKGISNYHYGINTPRPKNISYQVQIIGKGTVLGMSRFSLMDPQRRGYLHNWIFRQATTSEGLLLKKYDFINLYINGKSYGAYAIDEMYKDSFYNNNKIKFSPIINFESENKVLLREYVNEYCCGDSEFFSSSYLSTNYEDSNIVNKGEINNDYLQLVKIIKEKFVNFKEDKLAASELFDVDKMAKWLALSDVFGNWHGFTWANTKFYYNPFTDKAEPIPDDSFDENQIPPTEDYRLIKFYDLFNRGFFHNLIFKDKILRNKYFEYLDKFSSNTYLNKFFDDNKDQIMFYQNFLNSSFPYKYNQSIVYNNAEKIQKFLSPYKPIHVSNFISNGDFLSLEIANSHPAPVKIVKIYFNDELLDLNKIELREKAIIQSQILNPKKFRDKLHFQNINIPTDNINSYNILKFEFSIPGINKIYTQENQIKNFEINSVNKNKINKNYDESNQILEKFIKSHDNINNSIFIDEKLVVDKNLFISSDFSKIEFGPNAEIIFKDNANLIIETNLILLGNKDKPIKIFSDGYSNSCIHIINAKEYVILNNVKFMNLSNCNYINSKFSLTGAVNIYGSKIKIDNAYFDNNLSGDDYLNIVNSQFEIKNIYFSRTVADAFDIDFSNGLIKSMTCINCGTLDDNGDGLDISFSDVEIINYKFNQISDKALSIGEESIVYFINVEGEEANVCIAVKDGSNVYIKNFNVDQCNYDITVYNKKDELAKKSILTVENFSKQPKVFVENNNIVKIGNKIVKTNIDDFLNLAYGQ